MIGGTLKYTPFFSTLPDTIQQVLAWLNSQPLNELEPGRYDIDGDKIFMNVMAFTTRCPNLKKAEMHHEYADVRILIAGEEMIQYGVLPPEEGLGPIIPRMIISYCRIFPAPVK